jgi:predicted flap endonuclease-1-like 5' DNA nuclease
MTDSELQLLDEHLGAFRGRLERDRVVEQAGYLASGDVDGFERRFGKLER